MTAIDLYSPADIASEILDLLTQADATEPGQPCPFASRLLADPRTADQVNEALSFLESLAHATQKEIERQQARYRAIDEAAHQIERATLDTLSQAEATRAHGQRCTLIARRNPPSVRIEDAAAIPAQFLRQPPPPAAQPDKTAIRAAIEAEQYVPGAALVRTTRLERK